ncbi:hypothetical protein CH063_14317, partial [Colletotrichum higginsianum]
FPFGGRGFPAQPEPTPPPVTLHSTHRSLRSSRHGNFAQRLRDVQIGAVWCGRKQNGVRPNS